MTLDKRKQVSLTFGTHYKTIVSLGLTVMNSASTVIEKLTFYDFPYINALGITFDLAIK